MKKLQGKLLSVVLVLVAAVIFGVSVFVLPSVASEVARANPEVAYLKWPVLLGMFATVVPFVYAIVLTLQIIQKLDHSPYPTHEIVTPLRHIKYCAITIIVLYMAGFMMIAAANAMPPVVALLGFIIITLTVVVALGAQYLRVVVLRMS